MCTTLHVRSEQPNPEWYITAENVEFIEVPYFRWKVHTCFRIRRARGAPWGCLLPAEGTWSCCRAGTGHRAADIYQSENNTQKKLFQEQYKSYSLFFWQLAHSKANISKPYTFTSNTGQWTKKLEEGLQLFHNILNTPYFVVWFMTFRKLQFKS